MKECITHHYACDCREAEWAEKLKLLESENLENARLLGISGEREIALLAKIESITKERDQWKMNFDAHVALTKLMKPEGAQSNQVPEHLAAVKETNN